MVERSIEDLGLGGSIEEMRIYIKPEDPVFIISLRYREYVGRNTIGELASVEERVSGVKISLDSEIDLGDTLKSLWDMYGRDRVEQAGRMDIMVTGVDPEALKKIKIRDKAIDVGGKINELATRIIPEGFRVRTVIRRKNMLTIIAAEDPIRDEWKKVAEKLEAEIAC
ncbi:MAG: methanogenesis marker 17 protein [Candidatus Methanomethylicus sp.]|nr:methanogenesis marker 17 protein [Candidatus Methanomethylicus sp.]